MSGGRLDIHGLADIARVLLHEDVPTCLSLLQAIERAPDQVLAFGSEGGEDIIDLLLHHADDPAWPQEAQRAFRRALAAFRDPRVIAYFAKLLMLTGDSETLAIAAGRLSQEHPDDLHPLLAGCLQGDALPARARTVARLLAGSALLKPADRVRIEVLADVSVTEEVGLQPEDAQLWLQEIDRPFAADARECLERRGPEAFALLVGHWGSLSRENRAWLLGWGARVDPVHTVPLLTEALESDDAGMTLAALAVVPQLGPAAVLFGPAVCRLQEHNDPAVRAAVSCTLSQSYGLTGHGPDGPKQGGVT